MRIISGKYKGRRLSASDNLSIRPTTDRVKEYIFSIIAEYLDKSRVYDLFSGSGNLGIEALSRGATHVTFIDKNPASIQTLKKNLQLLDITDNQYVIVMKDALRFAIDNAGDGHFYFLDPPFVYPDLQQLVDLLVKNVAREHAVFVIEHEISNPISQQHADYEMLRQKKIGRSLISFIKKVQNNE
ncbi:MAG: 16S rRNA (guanine(966)-N(2))-methyltransferase RsmD [Caldithrix sp.]|nr:16S rRNA (guanine(966)-N(2))-methyltransferase RsmD [Caldithrix sp.]